LSPLNAVIDAAVVWTLASRRSAVTMISSREAPLPRACAQLCDAVQTLNAHAVYSKQRNGLM
jgi:hypothetical protein